MTIKIKASKKGTFTAAAKKSGMSVQAKASSVLSDPNASGAMKKKANFARNAREVEALMSEQIYDSNWGAYFLAAGITPDKDPMSLKSVIKTILGNLNAVGAGGMLARTTYSPTTADPATPIVSSTGLTSLNFTTGVDRPITFTVPTSGAVLVRITCFVKGGAAAGTSVVLGLTSNAHTSSPGTVVGTTGLVYLTPTATAADNGSLVTYAQVVTGLTAAAATTWYPAAMYSGTAPSIIAQGPTGATTVPTGAPFVTEVWAA